MAARFGATIVPFGAVGEDDIAEVGFFFFYQSLFGNDYSAFSFRKNIFLVPKLFFKHGFDSSAFKLKVNP